MPETGSRVAGAGKQLLFMLLALFMVFSGLELILGLAGVRPLAATEDPLVGFAGKMTLFSGHQNESGNLIMQTAPNKLPWFNAQQFPMKKGENSYRIFCMGGSTTFGRPYSDRTSFCGWLRAFLKAADPNRHWEVINAGGVSYASYRVARLMRELDHYEPDLFIVYSGQNEFLEERSYGKLKALPHWLLQADSALGHTRVYTALKKFVERGRSAVAPQPGELRAEVSEILNQTAGPTSYHRNDRQKQQILRHYRLNLARMADIARDGDAGIIYIKPAVNLKDMSPFKSEHRATLDQARLAHWRGLYARGNAALKAGHPRQALQAYRQALTIDDRFAGLHYHIGKALYALRRYKASEKAFWRAVDEDIAPLRMLSSMRGMVADAAHEKQAPMIDFERILKHAYQQDGIPAVFGHEYFLDHVHPVIEGHRLLALKLLRQLIDQGVVKPNADWGDEAKARVTRQVLASVDEKAHADALVNAGRVLNWGGKFDAARHLYRQRIKRFGADGDTLALLGDAALRGGDAAAAMQAYREALAVAPEKMASLHRDLGDLLAREGKRAAAMAQYRRALEKSPVDRFVTHERMAQMLAEEKSVRAAIRHFKAALRGNAGYVPALRHYMALMTQQHHYDKAEKLGQRLQKLDSDQASVHVLFGRLRMQQGQTGRAMAHFNRALALRPGMAEAEKERQRLLARPKEMPAVP